jgi:predicted Zn-dependent protease
VLEGDGGKLDEAEAAYRRALDLDPRNPHALEALGRLASASGRSEESLSLLCDRAVARVPSEPEPSLRCSEQLVTLGRQAEAIERLEAALREIPWSAPVALALARIYWDHQAPASAAQLARRAVRFGGGREAREFLETIHREGQVDRAGS